METKRVRFSVFGRVQGVGFRWAAERAAEQLGVGGWIANAAARDRVDGAVEGPEPAVAAFLDWLRRGPPSARVDRVVTAEEPLTGTGGFFIREG
ncbi:MAG: acylphosphatase [Firmicutes bacterium]|nr:acylphosphatase [Alicyclobacillaceae bacterium]MCL6496570.1 acylphosphatase [Bacillota bacterium]